MTEQAVVIITGMHRSGTSLVASLFQHAGVNVGDLLIGPSKGNQCGHFEDVDFNNFHAKVLTRFGQNYLVKDVTALGEINSDETNEALAIIERRNTNQIWGWKDPRTSLFLHFWHNLLPHARYIFVYRHPLEVVLSLLRRGENFDVEALTSPLAALRTWQLYNQMILDFYQQYREICFLGHVATVTQDTKVFIDLVTQKLTLPLQDENAQGLYHSNELKRVLFSATAISLLKRLAPEIMETYAQLEAQADLPGPISRQTISEQISHLTELEQLISLTSPKELPEKQLNHYFSLLLTILDPQTVLMGKEALDEIRIGRIGQHIPNVGTRATSLEQLIASKDAHIKNLEQLIASKDAHIKNLEQLIASKDAHIKNLEQLIASKTNQLEAIAQTKIWRLAQKWYKLKLVFGQLGRQSQASEAQSAQPTQSAQAGFERRELKPEHLQYIQQLSGKDIARQIPIRTLLKGVGYKLATKPGFGWLYHYRRIGRQALNEAIRYTAFIVNYDYDQNFNTDFKPYQVQIQFPIQPNRPRILHVIANFRTGGSSQLVVDLIERLGHLFEQEIITSYNPKPPNYIGPIIHEYPDPGNYQELLPCIEKFRPDIIHIHYWAECDEGWYEVVFEAAEAYGAKVIENINVPTKPRPSRTVRRYVYVSDYVCRKFGQSNSPNMTIYPGSDLHFFGRDGTEIPDNCIGMVYRLDMDKVNEHSIEVFIKVVQRRPNTKVLIVGGGPNLEKYQEAVHQSGINEAFTFTGYVSYQQLPTLYQQFSLFVAPVVRESFGQVSPFAMGMEIPVVGYNVGALAEVLGSDELLAPPNDSDALADIIIALLDDRERRYQIGQANFRRARQLFSIEAMIQKYNQLYDSLIVQPNIQS